MNCRYTNITLMKCQSCQERTHCRQCGSELSEILNARDDLSGAVVDMENKVLSFFVDAEDDEDTILDDLEELGLFV